MSTLCLCALLQEPHESGSVAILSSLPRAIDRTYAWWWVFAKKQLACSSINLLPTTHSTQLFKVGAHLVDQGVYEPSMTAIINCLQYICPLWLLCSVITSWQAINELSSMQSFGTWILVISPSRSLSYHPKFGALAKRSSLSMTTTYTNTTIGSQINLNVNIARAFWISHPCARQYAGQEAKSKVVFGAEFFEDQFLYPLICDASARLVWPAYVAPKAVNVEIGISYMRNRRDFDLSAML